MRLRTGAVIVFGLLIVVLMSLSVVLERTTTTFQRRAQDLTLEGESIRLAVELKNALLLFNRYSFLDNVDETQPWQQMGRKKFQEISIGLDALAKLSVEESEKKALKDASDCIQDYFLERDKLKKLSLPPTEQYVRLVAQLDLALESLHRLFEVHRLQIESSFASLQSLGNSVNRWLFLLLSIGAIVIGATLIGIFLVVFRPLQSLAKSVKELGGDKVTRAEVKGLKEIQEISKSLNLMADSLEEKRQDRLRFVASIAHDIRTPLHSIGMATEFLMKRGNAAEQDISRGVLRHIRNLDRLVGDLMDATRIEAGCLALEYATFDLKKLIQDAVELERKRSELHFIKKILPDSAILCHADEGRILQVINNLLSNAIKYSPNGCTVELEASVEDDWVQLSVRDYGIGIAPEEAQNIFKPFYRSQATRKSIHGIGLGLSASRRIIEAHGGSLSFQSKVGKGSVFQIRFPLSLRKKMINDPQCA